MSGALLPIPRWLVLDPSTGEPAAGAKAYFYASGTSTPLDTYNDPDLDPSHANTNPVVAGADGVFPVIYLQNASYRVLVTTSTGTTIYAAQDNIYDAYSLWAATTQTANTFYAGPASGSAAAPSFRTIGAADIVATGDPNADRIVFWDDSESAFKWLQASTGLTLSGTTLAANERVTLLNALLTATTLASDTTENTAYTYTVPGNTIGTARALRLTAHGQWLTNTGSGQQFNLRVKFGGATIAGGLSSTVNNGATIPWFVEVYIYPNNATNSQRASARMWFGESNTTPGTWLFTGVNWGITMQTLTVDTTQDAAIAVTWQNDTGANQVPIIYGALLELIQGT